MKRDRWVDERGKRSRRRFATLKKFGFCLITGTEKPIGQTREGSWGDLGGLTKVGHAS